MKKKFKLLTTLLFILFIGLIPTNVLALDEESDNYYLCLSSENYQIKNKNQLKQEDELYILENITLTQADAFYISNGKGERYYSKNNSEMHVEKNASLAYTIYFSKDKIFNEENVNDGMFVSDCHYTYALYDKGSYLLKLNETDTTKLTFNPYQKQYDSFEAKDIALKKDQTVSVIEYETIVDSETNEEIKNEKIISSITASFDGSYHIIYTPRKTIDGKEYGFNNDGEYGSGDDYNKQLYLEIEDEYYIVFKNLSYDKSEPIKINDENAYKIERDFEYPQAKKYTTESFLLNNIEQKIEYQIYTKTPAGFELINDDFDEDTTVSKLVGNYIGWYKLTLVEENGSYTSQITIVDKDFGDYYLALEANNYLYDSYGNIDLKEDYKFIKVEDDDDDYNSDYEQYKLTLTIDEDMLNTKMYITNGLSYYKNGTKFIEFTTPGEYNILFSTAHLYGREQNYKYTLIDNSIEYEEIRINNYEDLVKVINNCNENTEYSVNKYFYLTNDIAVSKDTKSIEAFYGVLDGNYHTIYNITIDTQDELKNLGFIRVLGKNAVIKRLYIENININASKGSNVGFVGYSYGTINDVTITGEISGLDHVGGVVGYNANYKFDDTDEITDSSKNYGYGLIKNTISNTIITGERFVGGIAGFNGGKIYECINNKEINNISYSSTKTIEAIGGIAGYSTGIIALSENNATVGYKDVGNFVGGIAGLSTGLFYYDKNLGNIAGQHYVGGIAGCYGSLKNDDNYKEYEEEEDLNKHFITYAYNTGECYGSDSIGGIIGWVTETGIKLTNSICVSNIEAKNGSKAGGIVGDFQNGTIESCFYEGTIMGSGINSGKYLGGIAGYSNGVINYVFAAANILGNDYLGGITGYMTNTAKLTSSISNSIFKPQAENTEYIGYISGYIDGLPFADVKNENIKYNYFVGEEYGGIYKFKFGDSSFDAAKELKSKELISKDNITQYVNSNFQGNGFIGGKFDYSYPVLRAFEMYEEDKDFTSDYDLEKLFNEHCNEYKELEEKYAVESIRINYFEWNVDKGEIDEKEKYELVKTYRFFFGDDITTIPEFKYAKLNGNNYLYSTDKGNYIANWEALSSEFKNQNIYATYTQIVTTLAYNDYLIEGSFIEGTCFNIKETGNNLVVTFYLNNNEIDVTSYTLKIKKANNVKYSVQIENNEEFTPTEYGDYIVISVNNGEKTFVIKETPNKIPTLYIVLFVAIIVFIITFLFTLIITKKVEKNKIKKQLNEELDNNNKIENEESSNE